MHCAVKVFDGRLRLARIAASRQLMPFASTAFIELLSAGIPITTEGVHKQKKKTTTEGNRGSSSAVSELVQVFCNIGFPL